MSTASGHTASSVERPQERSRNAKAQARHRAKRKAYIEQLEQTVTKLQAALGYSPEQVSTLPPSSVTIRELQQDNLRLQKEIEDLRRALADAGGGHRRGALAPYDPRGCDRESYKRKKSSSYLDGVYMPGDSPHLNDSRPPPLTIPQPLSHHYGSIPSQNGSQNGQSLFSLHGPAFQLPHTPSGSSATSSPPFSPVQMQSHVNGSQYNSSVKVEEDSYSSSTPHYSSSMHHSYPNQTHPDMDWHYSSERGHVHR